MKYVGIILLGVALLMIKSENGPWIEGQGSLVHWKYKALAALLFLTSGLLGIFAFSHEDLLLSPLGLVPEVLLPLLSGIFGASALILSLSTGAEIPEQNETEIKISASSSLYLNETLNETAAAHHAANIGYTVSKPPNE